MKYSIYNIAVCMDCGNGAATIQDEI